jgi:menaquinone-dependent protoporphyrinogen oxidase
MTDDRPGLKVLLAVASKHGSTLEIAQVLSEELQKSGLSVDLRDLHKGDEEDAISGYAAVILGSAIYAGSWLPQAQHFAEQHQAVLSVTPLWLFSSGPLGRPDPKPHFDPVELKTSVGDINIMGHRVFVGRLDPADLNFGERLITRMVKAPSGDFRDWEKIRNWGQEIALELRPLIPAGR